MGRSQERLKIKKEEIQRWKCTRWWQHQNLLYGSEIWAPAQNDRNKIQSAEMKFLRNIKGCSILNKTKNNVIRKKLKLNQ